jgi:hypothetical protein
VTEEITGSAVHKQINTMPRNNIYSFRLDATRNGDQGRIQVEVI